MDSIKIILSKRLFFFLVFSLFVTSISVQASDDTVICTGHPEYPPFMWEEKGKLVGVGPELVQIIFNQLGQKHEFKPLGSWARAQEMMARNHVDLLVGAYSNEQRRKYMMYSKAYALDPTSIFVRKDQPFKFDNKSDLKGFTGVSMFGDSFGDDLDKYIAEELKVLRVYDSESLFKQLISKRVNYILWGDYPCQINASIKGYDQQIRKLDTPIAVQGMYMTISRKSRFLNLIDPVNFAIDRLKADGTIQSLFDKYLKQYINSQKVSRPSN